MQYDVARTQIKDGDVLAFEGHSFFSRLIRLESGGYITHVAFAIWLRFGYQSKDRLCVFEAMEGSGVRLVPLDWIVEQRAKTNDRIHWLALKDGYDRAEVLGFALEQWGHRYASPWQFVSSFGRLTKWIRKKLHVPAAIDRNRPFCSWLVADALMKAGFKWSTEPSATTPAQVFDFDCLDHRGILQR